LRATPEIVAHSTAMTTGMPKARIGVVSAGAVDRNDRQTGRRPHAATISKAPSLPCVSGARRSDERARLLERLVGPGGILHGQARDRASARGRVAGPPVEKRLLRQVRELQKEDDRLMVFRDRVDAGARLIEGAARWQIATT
jgi:hypothetical protein